MHHSMSEVKYTNQISTTVKYTCTSILTEAAFRLRESFYRYGTHKSSMTVSAHQAKSHDHRRIRAAQRASSVHQLLRPLSVSRMPHATQISPLQAAAWHNSPPATARHASRRGHHLIVPPPPYPLYPPRRPPRARSALSAPATSRTRRRAPLHTRRPHQQRRPPRQRRRRRRRRP